MPTPVIILLCIAAFFLLPLVMCIFMGIFDELSRLYEEFNANKGLDELTDLSVYISMIIAFLALIVMIIYKFLL